MLSLSADNIARWALTPQQLSGAGTSNVSAGRHNYYSDHESDEFGLGSFRLLHETKLYRCEYPPGQPFLF
jgi:hypothetical protein